MNIFEISAQAGFIGKFSLCVSSDQSAEPYTAIPNKSNPRWLMPVSNKGVLISSFALYQPSLLRAKILKKMALGLARLGLFDAVVKNGLCLKRTDDEIKRIFKRDVLYYAVFTGSEGCHRKLTVQVMDAKGTILGYIKASDNEEINNLLKNEADILNYLAELKIKNGLFPRAMYDGKFKDTNILVQNTLKSTASTFSSRLSMAHVNFLSEIFRKSAALKKFGESDFRQRLGERLGTLSGASAGNWQALSWEAIDFLDRSFGDKVVPFGLCHRDLTPWNTFFHDDKLYVFDWEYAKKDYPPLFDILHFITQDGLLVRKLKPEALVRNIANHKENIVMYLGLVGVDKRFIESLTLCYLLDVILFYLEREPVEIRGALRGMLEKWSEMMKWVIIRGINA
jgi:hypothetical protein